MTTLIATIKLNNKTFQLSCNEGALNELLELANNVDSKIHDIKINNPKASYELLLVMTALSLQQEIQTINQSLNQSDPQAPNNEDKESGETLSAIVEYLESLAKKLGKG